MSPKSPLNPAETLLALQHPAAKRLHNGLARHVWHGHPLELGSIPRIARLTESEVLGIRGLGGGMLTRLQEALDAGGYSLGSDTPDLPDTDEPEEISPDERVQLMNDIRDECVEHLELIKARRAELPPGGFDSQLTSAISTLGKTITQLNTEARQQEKHEARVVTHLSDAEEDAVVMDAFANMQPSRRTALLKVLNGLQGSVRLLGHE